MAGGLANRGLLALDPAGTSLVLGDISSSRDDPVKRDFLRVDGCEGTWIPCRAMSRGRFRGAVWLDCACYDRGHPERYSCLLFADAMSNGEWRRLRRALCLRDAREGEGGRKLRRLAFVSDQLGARGLRTVSRASGRVSGKSSV